LLKACSPFALRPLSNEHYVPWRLIRR
jgi:hypothetical protein